jgi:hypothetical protein
MTSQKLPNKCDTLKQSLKEYKAAYKIQIRMMKYIRRAMDRTVGKILKLEAESIRRKK